MASHPWPKGTPWLATLLYYTIWLDRHPTQTWCDISGAWPIPRWWFRWEDQLAAVQADVTRRAATAAKQQAAQGPTA